MVEDTDKLDLSSIFTLREQHYRLTNNTKRIIQLQIYKLIIYTIGNLGIRILGFIYIIGWLRQINKLSPFQVFVMAAVPSSLFIPTLFHQGYNVIQFAQYALILTSISTIVAVDNSKISPSKKIIVASIILLISLPTTVKSFFDTVHKQVKNSEITWQELDALNYLKSNTPTTSVILTHPDTKHHYLIIAPALASRRAYFSSDTFAALTNTAYQDRDQKMKDFFDPQANIPDQISFLRDANINYIYLDSGYQDNLKDSETVLPITPTFSNSEVTIYQVNL